MNILLTVMLCLISNVLIACQFPIEQNQKQDVIYNDKFVNEINKCLLFNKIDKSGYQVTSELTEGFKVKKYKKGENSFLVVLGEGDRKMIQSFSISQPGGILDSFLPIGTSKISVLKKLNANSKADELVVHDEFENLTINLSFKNNKLSKITYYISID